jgi:probable phosphoglycerate mutase
MCATASALQDVRFDRVFSSPLRRAYEAARIISRGGAIERIEEFREIHFGLFEGLTAEEIRKRHPAEFARWNRERLLPHYAYPQGEARAEFRARIERGAERMLKAWRPEACGGSALLVAHRGVIRTLVSMLTGAEPSVELASIHILENDSEWKVRSLDGVAHLKRQR